MCWKHAGEPYEGADFYRVNQFSQALGSGDAFDTEAKEFVCLVQMFGHPKRPDPPLPGSELARPQPRASRE
jgi:hypothetical protein